ncbi:DUF6311 domain-containing protein [Clostridium algidicarnis]|uniref:DUF6311 domain-containing protein n=1 Tax=Clostridium algidicarnis TaxID=37659 RepID=UPI001CF574A7|nr:DUF6311 domain-containing protein [Clostridium algidicarnis]MCB2286360.1 DUF6311 domain-containing protein [Clostridium algidicarnis]
MKDIGCKIRDIYNKLNNNTISYFIMGSVLGIMAFLLIYGVKVINFTNVDWLMISGDLTQHYIGWEFFRDSAWAFPLGMSNNYAYPIGVAITYTDSIPIFALLFKLIRGVLPQRFQYFGLWGIMSFALQGGFAAIIFKKYIKNIPIVLVATSFIVINPILLRKMFVHTALASHWIILMSLAMWVYKERFTTTKSKVIAWSSVNILAVLIHPYFVPMTMTIMLGFVIDDYIYGKKVKDGIITIVSSIASVLIAFWIIGGFTGESAKSVGLGDFSMNINALFNPMGWSRFITKDLPLAKPEQYEGFQYLGVGIIILIPICLIVFIIINRHNVRNIFSTGFMKRFFKKYTSFLVVFIILFFMSLSNVITINNHIIFEYNLPKYIEEIFNIFRSTGRLFWPVTYIIIFALIIYVVTRCKSKKCVLALLTVLLVVQVGDLSNKMVEKRNYYTSDIEFNYILKSEFWEGVGENFEHIMLIPTYINTYSHMSRLATDHNMTLNTGSYARGPNNKIDEIAAATVGELKNGKSNDKTAYIIQSYNILEDIMRNAPKDMYTVVNVVGKVDNYFILYSNKDFSIDRYKGDIEVYTSKDFVSISFQDYIEELLDVDDGVAIIISKRGGSLNGITKDELERLNKLGVKSDLSNINENNYSSIIFKNDPSSTLEKVSSNNVEIKLNVGQKLSGDILQKDIIVRSGKINLESYSHLLFNHVQYSMNREGLNITVYDVKNNKVLSIASFKLKDNNKGSLMRCH